MPSRVVNCGGSGVSDGDAFGLGEPDGAARRPRRGPPDGLGLGLGTGVMAGAGVLCVRYVRREPGGGSDPENDREADAEAETTEVHLVCFSRTRWFAAC